MKKAAVSVSVVLAVVSLCSGQWLERRLAVGDTIGFKLEGGVVVNPMSGNVYLEGNPTRVFNPSSAARVGTFSVAGSVVFCPASAKGYIFGSSVAIIDAVADTLLGSRTLPFRPAAIAYSAGSNRLYLKSPHDTDPLFVFDPAGDTMLAALDLGCPVRALLWDSTADRLYVGTGPDSGVLKVVDCCADTLVGDVRLELTDVSLLALSTGSHKLYCGGVPDTAGGDRVVVVSTDSLAPVAGLSRLPLPVSAVYGPVVDRLYCFGSRADTLYVADCSSDTVRSRVPVKLSSLAANTVNGLVYVGQRRAGPVLVLDTTDALSGAIPCPVTTSNNVGAVTFNPVRSEVYASLTDDVAYIADAATNSVTGVIDYIAYTPYDMLFNPVGSKLYLFCPTQNAVLVMDSTFTTTATLYGAVTNSSAFMVMDSVRNRIYVADNEVLRVLDCSSDSVVQESPIYGIDHPVSVLVPDLGKLFIFCTYGDGDSVYVYDCATGSVQRVIHLSDAAPCAVYDPHSRLVFFACEDAPAVRALDPATGAVVRQFDLGMGSTRGRMTVDPDLGRLYFTDQNLGRIFTIDVDAGSVIGSKALAWNIDTLVFDQRFGKVYMCSRDRASVLVFGCGQDTIVRTVLADFGHAALMNQSNDKLYLRYGAVLNCHFDYVMTQLESINPRSMAWDAGHNRMFQADLYRLYVYRDDPSAVEETRIDCSGPLLTVSGNPARGVVRLRFELPRGQRGRLLVRDAAGRLVHCSSGVGGSSGSLDLRSEPAGVYFVSLCVGESQAIEKVVVQR
jgi:DNA-binding beta-propeller fold protein YncE